MEYADRGVRVNAVAPGVIRTPMAERAFLRDATAAARYASMHPLGRVGEPEEVARAVVWLCSANASFTTGHILPVDGGILVS
ncbi:2,5-dichloro-2,5-cyclohexadiene-1,4-diol dehydrogenase [compost metagenome]